MHIFEGFFGKPSAQKKQGMMSIEKLMQDFGYCLVNGQPISDEDWTFIDNYMDGYVKPADTKSLRGIISDAIEAYGNDVHLNWINVSEIVNMRSLFGYRPLFNGDVSRWDTQCVQDMSEMFCGCEKFNNDISDWNTSHVTDMNNMFNSCTVFNQDISRWDVSQVKLMYFMFNKCDQFNQDLSGWDVSNVTDMERMFRYCGQFDCDLSSWNVKKVKKSWCFGQDSGLSIMPNFLY